MLFNRDKGNEGNQKQSDRKMGAGQITSYEFPYTIKRTNWESKKDSDQVNGVLSTRCPKGKGLHRRRKSQTLASSLALDLTPYNRRRVQSRRG
jgi:hypothetical protein